LGSYVAFAAIWDGLRAGAAAEGGREEILIAGACRSNLIEDGTWAEEAFTFPISVGFKYV